MTAQPEGWIASSFRRGLVRSGWLARLLARFRRPADTRVYALGDPEQDGAPWVPTPTCQAPEDVCDGTWHQCGDCGGEGCREDDDSDGYICPDLVTCQTCHGRGGWPCPYPIGASE